MFGATDIANLTSSTAWTGYTTADGVVVKGFLASNPGEAERVVTYLEARAAGQNPATPKMVTKLGKALIAFASQKAYADPVVVPPPAPTSVFDYAGLYYWHGMGWHHSHAPRMQAARMRWACVQLVEETTVRPEMQADLRAGWHTKFESCGVQIFGAGWADADPATNARLAVEQCKEWGLRGWVCNAEQPFLDAGFGKSKTWLDAWFAAGGAKYTLALSCLGGAPAPWVYGLDHQAWIKAGAHVLPQNYTNEWPNDYTARLCFEHWIRAGWPKDRIHLTLGYYGNYRRDLQLYRQELLSLRAQGHRGFSVYLGEALEDNAAAWSALKQMVDDGLALA